MQQNLQLLYYVLYNLLNQIFTTSGSLTFIQLKQIGIPSQSRMSVRNVFFFSKNTGAAFTFSQAILGLSHILSDGKYYYAVVYLEIVYQANKIGATKRLYPSESEGLSCMLCKLFP